MVIPFTPEEEQLVIAEISKARGLTAFSQADIEEGVRQLLLAIVRGKLYVVKPQN